MAKKIRKRPKIKKVKAEKRMRGRVRGLIKLFDPRLKQRKRIVTKRKPPMKPQVIQNTNREAVMAVYLQRKRQLELQQALRSRQLSPSTQVHLQQIMAIQNKGKRDNEEMQRRIRERKIVESATSLLATPYIFKGNELDVTVVKGDNILMAPSVFKENPEDMILKKRGRTILDTQENTLKF